MRRGLTPRKSTCSPSDISPRPRPRSRVHQGACETAVQQTAKPGQRMRSRMNCSGAQVDLEPQRRTASDSIVGIIREIVLKSALRSERIGLHVRLAELRRGLASRLHAVATLTAFNSPCSSSTVARMSAYKVALSHDAPFQRNLDRRGPTTSAMVAARG